MANRCDISGNPPTRALHVHQSRTPRMHHSTTHATKVTSMDKQSTMAMYGLHAICGLVSKRRDSGAGRHKQETTMLYVQLCVVSSLTGMHPVPVLYVGCLFIFSLCFLACFIGPCRLKHILCSETIRTKWMHSQAVPPTACWGDSSIYNIQYCAGNRKR